MAGQDMRAAVLNRSEPIETASLDELRALVHLGGKALKVLLHEEEMREFRVCRRHGDEPRRCHREKDDDSGK